MHPRRTVPCARFILLELLVVGSLLAVARPALAQEPLVWTPGPTAATAGELADAGHQCGLATGQRLTVQARVRRLPTQQGLVIIAQTAGWTFGIKEDGALYFAIAGVGGRHSVAPPKVAPLYWPAAASWPPPGTNEGKVPLDTWTEVGWSIDAAGGWTDSYVFSIAGQVVPGNLGFGPFRAPAAVGPIQIGAATQTGLAIAQVTVWPERMLADDAGHLVPVVPPAPAPRPVARTGGDRLIIAHRMNGFGPAFHGSTSPDDRSSGAFGFLFPVKRPGGPNLTGYGRDGHIGALHAPFVSVAAGYAWEIAQAQAGGVDAFVLDTCGGTDDLGVAEQLLRVAEAQCGSFKIGLCLDFSGQQAARVEAVRVWLARHRESPALLRLGGRPAFATYIGGFPAAAEVNAWFAELREAAGEPIFLHLDLCEFPNRGTTAAEWQTALAPYLAAADGVGCFYSRCGFTRDAAAFAAMAQAVRAANKHWGMSLWPNYYTPGRRLGMEHLGADNSRLWDRMWRLAVDTRADYILMTTWNDLSEETSVMPSLRKHFVFMDLLANYYGPWWRSGVEPTATHDQVYAIYRPYRTDAARPLIAGPLAPGCASQDVVEVRTFLTAPGIIELAGSGSQAVPAGMSSIEFPARLGPVSVTLLRQPGRPLGFLPRGRPRTVLQFTAPECIADRPWRQDFALRAFSSEEAGHWQQWFSGPPHWLSEYGDDDHNGLPNWFERYYFGRWQGTDPTADPDADGRSNLQEYLAGTDPGAPPVVYPAGYVWNSARQFRGDDETYPAPDSLGTSVWEYEFMPPSPAPRRFAAAELLVGQIPAWLERGNSWSFAVGRPQGDLLSYTGEGDSASSIVWTSPLTGTVTSSVQLTHLDEPWATGTVTVTLSHASAAAPLASDAFAPTAAPLTRGVEITVHPGDRLRLAVSGLPGGARWGLALGWQLTTTKETNP